MRRAAAAAWVTAVLACSAVLGQAPAQPRSFEGEFSSGKLVVVLHRTQQGVSGTITIDGASNPVAGTLKEGHLAGSFESEGSSFPFEATMEGEDLVLTSGGATHRLARRAAEGNPLSDPGVSKASDAPPAAEEQTDAATLTRRYPQVLALAPGVSIRYPAAWTVQEMGDFKALLPGGQGLIPTSMYLVQAIDWPAGVAIGSPEVQAQIGTLLGQIIPGLSKDGAVEKLGRTEAEGFRLRFKAPKFAGQAPKIDVLLKGDHGRLIAVMGVGEESSLKSNEAEVREMFRLAGANVAAEAKVKTEPSADGGSLGPLDPEVIGTWRHSEGFSDSTAGASLAIETVYRFNADGTYTLGSQAAGGDANVGMDTGFKESQRGRWTASGGVLKTVDSEETVREVHYLFHEGNLVFKRGNGKYVIWGR